MAYDVFISYRRETGVDDARLLQQALKARGYEVFFDFFNPMRDGNFMEKTFKAINEAPVFILMLTEGALNRCDRKEDWVRSIRAVHTVLFLSSKDSNASNNVVGEIGAALHFRKRIVPVRLDAAEYHDNLLMDVLYLDTIDVSALGREKSAEKIRKVVFLSRANSDSRLKSRK